jgi:hypothetical protein
MKRALGILMVGLLFTAADLAAQSKVFERTVQLGSGGSLDLTARKGTVRLVAWDREQVEIRARIEADTDVSADYARRSVDATTIDVNSGTNHVSIRPNFDNVPTASSWLFGDLRSIPSIHYEVRAPRRLDLRLDVDRSATLLSGFQGSVFLVSDRSEVNASDLTGRVRARLDRSGQSRFSDIRGSIDVVADRTDLRIGFVRLDEGSRIQIDRGDAEVSIARGQGLDLDTNLSRRASFDTNLDLLIRGRIRENPSGSVNGGGPRLQIEADRSRVRLRG